MWEVSIMISFEAIMFGRESGWGELDLVQAALYVFIYVEDTLHSLQFYSAVCITFAYFAYNKSTRVQSFKLQKVTKFEVSFIL